MASVLGLVAALGLLLLPAVAGAAKGKSKGKKVGHQLSVMSRNLYLGADLSPLLDATSLNQAVDVGGQVVNQVHATRFPSVRAALLANEIKKKKPDVVGLQEVAWWRTGPVNAAAVSNPSAPNTDPLGGDFLTDLLAQLNSGNTRVKKAGASAKKGPKLRYRVAVVKNEFDAELPVNDNGQGSGIFGADHNERLTMRDVILVRKGGGIKFANPSTGTFNTLLHVVVGGAVQLDVTRGWTAVDVKAHGRRVHVVNTHLEAFDSDASNRANDGQNYPKGGIREAQAKQLVSALPNGAIRPGAPTILIGDLNSDFPVHGDQVFPGDALAFQAVTAGGFTERALTPPPFGCCIQDPNLANPSTAGVDHRVDHIMSNSGKVKFRKGSVTSTYANGLWSSDHFGVFSSLLIK